MAPPVMLARSRQSCGARLVVVVDRTVLDNTGSAVIWQTNSTEIAIAASFVVAVATS